jgi:hypothetical protein
MFVAGLRKHHHTRYRIWVSPRALCEGIARRPSCENHVNVYAVSLKRLANVTAVGVVCQDLVRE